MEEAVRDSVAEQRERLMESLRIYGGHYAEFGRRFAAWLDLHSTDATAVLEIAAARAARSWRDRPSSFASSADLSSAGRSGEIMRTVVSTSFRDGAQHQARNLEIPGSVLRTAPE